MNGQPNLRELLDNANALIGQNADEAKALQDEIDHLREAAHAAKEQAALEERGRIAAYLASIIGERVDLPLIEAIRLGAHVEFCKAMFDGSDS
jgi:hypothetical protein